MAPPSPCEQTWAADAGRVAFEPSNVARPATCGPSASRHRPRCRRSGSAGLRSETGRRSATARAAARPDPFSTAADGRETLNGRAHGACTAAAPPGRTPPIASTRATQAAPSDAGAGEKRIPAAQRCAVRVYARLEAVKDVESSTRRTRRNAVRPPPGVASDDTKLSTGTRREASASGTAIPPIAVSCSLCARRR